MQLDEIETIRYHLLVSQIVFGAGYCMLLYDWICCIDREFKFIWKAKFSFIKVIYLFCRYWPIATVPYILWAYTVPHTWATCERIFRIPVAIATWNQLGAETVLLARTVAFLGNSRVVLGGLTACLIAATAYQIWVVFKPMLLIPFIADDRYGVCLPTSAGHEIFGFFITSLAFDSLVTILMGYRVFQLRREAGGELSRSPLVQLFVSEGLWYFVVVSIANLVNGLMFAQKQKSLQATAVPFSNMLPPILACRLILDLREHGSSDGSAWLTTGRGNVGFILPAFLYRSKPPTTAPQVSTIRFQPGPRRGGQGSNTGMTGSSTGTGTDSSGLASTISDLSSGGRVDGDVGQKKSFVGGLTSIKDDVEEEGDDIVDARDVLVAPTKEELGDNDVPRPPGMGGDYFMSYQMRPLSSSEQRTSRGGTGGRSKAEGNVV